MATLIPRTKKQSTRACEYFLKLLQELELEKYKLPQYKELFMLASFQVMHDSDLAYGDVYTKCALNASSKEELLDYIEQEERFSDPHPISFDQSVYRKHILIATAEIKHQLAAGTLDYLFTS